MAARARRRDPAFIGFDSIAIEGGVLGADWLAKVAQLEAPNQSGEDYRIPKGLQLRDEIGRSWRIAQASFREFEEGRAGKAAPLPLCLRFLDGLLRDAFGFASLKASGPRTVGERVYPVAFVALGDRVPVVVAPAAAGLDTPLAELGDGRRRSAFGLLQEYLNATEDSLWGLACDGLTLRLARDNASMTRPAWVEADLGRIFREDLLPDFAALWLLIHESRFGRVGDLLEDCPLEKWRDAGREAGTVARGKLRKGFEEALALLGKGFVAHPGNKDLREALHSGRLTRDAYYGQLLRLVYRMIFVLTVEERNLLHPADVPEEARSLYAEGYAMRRMRDRAIRRIAHDRNVDLWEGLKITFRGLSAGEPRLGIPALGGLFAPHQCEDLDKARLENHSLLGALFHLAWLREPGGLVRVNWRDMGPDELGYVYEGLLELVPQISEDGRSFQFVGGDESRGNARKTTGSYYTPEELVQLLLESALDPVIDRTVKANQDRPVDALLELSVVDPACGSGHFLLAAARRLADRVARLRAAGTPTPRDYQHALRDVVRQCVYGVDMNPLAVELCKVSLWMESIDPGMPLTFLESHIRLGNALIGTTKELMGSRIPVEAWEPLEGDDRKLTAELRKTEKADVSGQRLFRYKQEVATGSLRDAVMEVEQAPDSDAGAMTQKEERWRQLLASQVFEHEKLVADAWCAAFVWPKEKRGPIYEAAPTTGVWLSLRDREAPPPPVLVETTKQLAKAYGFFHWEIAFPQVFARGGFDVVLGNPPWERVKLQEQEFFAQRDPSIATARNASERKKAIEALPVTNPALWQEWSSASRVAQGQSHLARASGRYPLCGKGDVNTYALFAEHNWRILGSHGRAGFIVPSGIATDDTTKEYFQALLDRSALASIYHFENEDQVFKGLHHAYRFVLLTIGPTERADLVFYARRATDIREQDRHVSLSPEDFATLNPNTRTCPTFRSRRDAEINLAMYRRAGVLWREDSPDGNPWGLRFMAMFHMANDSGLFRQLGELESAGWKLDGNRFVKGKEVMLPLYEAKMVHHFDHRFGTYEGQTEAQANQGKLPELDDKAHSDSRQVTLPRYWVSNGEVEARLEGVWDKQWMLGWRDVTGAAQVRTLISAIVPRAAVGHKLPLGFPAAAARTVCGLYANLCSLVLDYAARQKIGAVSMTYFIVKQLPVLSPAAFGASPSFLGGMKVADWIRPRVVELLYTSHDLQSFAADCGEVGPPFEWSPDRRFQLRCELDAAFLHLYGISRNDADHILDTFPVLQRNDIRTHREYRTKRVILETYDALAKAAESGRIYASPLAPPRRAK